MKLASHLKQSPYGVFYFRLVIPQVLRPLYNGQRELKRSLHTRNPATARRLAYILWVQTEQRLREAKRAMSGHDPKKFDPNNRNTWPTGAEDARQWEAQIGNLTIRADPSIPGDSEAATAAIRQLIGRGSRSSDPDDIENIGIINHLYTPPPPAPPPPADTTIRFTQARDLYLQLVDKEPQLAETTRREMKGVFENFLNWTNPRDPQLSQIDGVMMERYMNYLLLESPNKQTKKPGLSQASVKKMLSFLNGLFVNRKKDFPKGHETPTTGISPYRKGTQKKIQRKNRYLSFSSDELQQIFNPATVGKLKKPHEFWCPLLGLYTGARLEELAQLRQSDIEQQGSLTVVHFREEEFVVDPTDLKTDNAERSVPLHPDLIEMGFLEYVQDAKEAAPGGRIFPYLREDISGFYDVPSEAFARYLDQLGITHRKKTFHSFRSTINSHLKKRGHLSEELCCLYVGQGVDSINDRHYSDNLSAQNFQELVVSKIALREDVPNLSRLEYKKGRFGVILRKELERRQRHLKRKKLQQARAEFMKRDSDN